MKAQTEQEMREKWANRKSDPKYGAQTQVSKHTQGPWEACHDADGDYVIFAGEGVNHKIIAITNLDSETDEANAGLIAAAPDLLEALERIILAEFGSLKHPQIRHSGLWEGAVAAIRKAKGETQ